MCTEILWELIEWNKNHFMETIVFTDAQWQLQTPNINMPYMYII